MEKRVQIGIKLPPDLVEELDSILADRFEFPPSRTQAIEQAIRDWVAGQRDAKRRSPRRKL